MQWPLQENEHDGADLEVRRARPLLGTVVEIRAMGRSAERSSAALHAAIDAAFAQVELVHRLMSYQDPDSELSRLNRCAVDSIQRVDPHTYSVLSAAMRFARLSSGAFDPCVPSRHASWEDVELLGGHRMRLRRPLRLDLGGIAKGYAVDLATRTLQGANVRETIVNAGGDLRVSGTRTQEVSLRHPEAPTVGINPLQLRDAALASSAAYFSRSLPVSALVDPRTREPYRGNDTVSVRAADCMTADALTKVVLFAPSRIAERVLEECGAEAFVLRAQHRPGGTRLAQGDM